jgi:hypothetical protein
MSYRVSLLASLIILILIFSAIPVKSTVQHYVTVGSYGTISLAQVTPAVRASIIDRFGIYVWHPTQDQGTSGAHYLSDQRYAETADIMCTGYSWDSDTTPNLKKYNPDLICLPYWSVRYVNAEKLPSLFALFNSKGWLLKDSSGNLIHRTDNVNLYYQDIRNEECISWLVNRLRNEIQSGRADGIYLDDWNPAGGQLYMCNAYPAGYPTGWSYPEVAGYLAHIAHELKTVSPIVCANCIFEASRWQDYKEIYKIGMEPLTDIEMESFVSNLDVPEWWTEERWKQGVDTVIELEQTYPNRRILLAAINTGRHSTTAYYEALPPGATKEQFATYAFSSLLLAVEKQGQTYFQMHSYGVGYDNPDFTVNTFPQSMYSIDIGLPSGTYTELPGTHIYYRQFTKGIVLVNPSTGTYTVNLNSAYTDANTGNPVSSTVTMQPHTGLILQE